MLAAEMAIASHAPRGRPGLRALLALFSLLTALSVQAAAPTVAPENLRFVVGDGQVEFLWDPVAGATGYQYRLKAGKGAYSPWTTVAGSATRHMASGLANGVVHRFKVRALNGNRKGPSCPAVSATPEAETEAPPVARAGHDRSVAEDRWAKLDGSGSSDAAGRALAYSWRQSGGRPTVSLSGADTATPSFEAPNLVAPATLTFELTVSAGDASATDTVDITIDADNDPPTARAAPEGRTFGGGGAVRLDGSGSWDPEGEELAFSWRQTAGPDVSLTGADTALPGFDAPELAAAATLTFELTVSDGGASATDTVDVAVAASAQPPVAHAGRDRSVAEDRSTKLDGSRSSDAAGRTLAYSWRQTAGPEVSLSGVDTATPSFEAPNLVAPTKLTFELTVSAGGASATDAVHITIDADNDPPTAHVARENGTFAGGKTVRLDGSGSWDPEGEELTFSWRQTAGATVSLTGADTALPSFDAPKLDAAATLTFELTVSDGGASATDTVDVSVAASQRRAPTVAPENLRFVVGDGQIEFLWDPVAGATGYQYRLKAGKNAYSPWTTVAGSATRHTASGLANGVVHRFKVRALNGNRKGPSCPAVSATPEGEVAPPVARAGTDRSVAEDRTATLDGGGSTGPAGHALTYSWRQSGGRPTVSLSGANTATPSFEAPNLVAPATLTFELTVSAGGESASDTVAITIDADNDPPTAYAVRESRTLGSGGGVWLDGSGSWDPEGEELSFSWRQTAGATVSLTDADTAVPWFDPPELAHAATLTFELTVSAGGASATDTVDVPVAASAPAIAIADRHVRGCVEEALDKEAGEAITAAEMATITTLYCAVTWSEEDEFGDSTIVSQAASLAGLEHATGLVELNIGRHVVSDLSPLAGLTSLRVLSAPIGPIANLSPLAKLTGLTDLWLGGNAIADISPLAGLVSLRELNVGANAVTNIDAVTKLTSLTWLGIYSNAISDISPVAGLTALRTVQMANNNVADLGPLVRNPGIGDGDNIEVHGNPIPCGANAQSVRALQARGARVYADDVPLPSPRKLVATPGDGRASLRWRAPAGCAVAGYEFRQGVGKSPVFHAWTAIGSGTSHTVSGLANGAQHAFEVRAVGVRGAGKARRVQVALAADPEAEVEIRDAQLRRAFAQRLSARKQAPGAAGSGKTAITQADMAAFTVLDLDGRQISDLDGLEHALNLRTLRLYGNSISNLAPLTELPFLSALWLGANGLRDISALANMAGLTELALDGNRISDITALSELPSLTRLWLNDNAITDIAPLAANTELGGGDIRPDGSSDYIDLRGNPLDAAAKDDHAPLLRRRGAAVLVDEDSHTAPIVVAGGSSFGDGFVRVVNRTGTSGEVSVAAIDNVGRRHGPTTLSIGPKRGVAFDSEDLEHGNSAIGMDRGVGNGEGDWRLELRSPLDIDVSAYARTGAGLVASMNVLAPESYATHFAPTFNPGSNTSRVSKLRIINPAHKMARVLIEGVDDAGVAATVAVTVPAGGVRDFTAAALESGAGEGIASGGLGDGAGKWRLRATSFDGVRVLSLMAADGQLTNLSATPETSADSRQHLTLFPADEWPGEVLLRFVNESPVGGSVEIRAFDKDGHARAPVFLAIGAGAAVHITPRELAEGNAAKGLPTGVGEDAWRLELRSPLNAYAGSYLRPAGAGPLRTMHTFAPRIEGGASRVAFFGAAGDISTGTLRLVNVGETAARVAISGTDDSGRSPGGVVYATVPAGATRDFTAAGLETGSAEGLSGALGDGTGEWRLLVESDGDVYAASLIQNSTGQMENVSR